MRKQGKAPFRTFHHYSITLRIHSLLPYPCISINITVCIQSAARPLLGPARPLLVHCSAPARPLPIHCSSTATRILAQLLRHTYHAAPYPPHLGFTHAAHSPACSSLTRKKEAAAPKRFSPFKAAAPSSSVSVFRMPQPNPAPPEPAESSASSG